MKIILDGAEMTYEKGVDEKIAASLKKENRVIRSLAVNDIDMVNASLAEALAEPAEGKVVKIETCPADDLLWESMQDAREYIPKLQEGLPQIREQLLDGNVNAVFNMVDAVLEGLDWLGLTFRAFISQGYAPQAEKSIMEEYANLEQILKELEIALRANKLERACDIFEEQVSPFLEKLLLLVDEILQERPVQGKK